MCELMRESLRELTKSCRDAHAGLLLQRGLPKWEDGEKIEKQKLLDKVAGVSPSEVYKLAFNRWVRATADENRFTFLCAEIVGRLYIGLNSAGALETGICTQHSYGMPFLPGSSVKGAVRHYAENVGLPENICKVLFGGDDGEDGVAGALVWHDAWWIPVPSEKPFVGEVVTVHHQNYYGGGQSEADEMESPVPNQQIATQGSFYFVVEAGEGTTAWAEFARQLLGEMLAQQGMGAKTASGYGYFAETDGAAWQQVRTVREAVAAKRQAAQQAAQLATLPEHERIILEWQGKVFGAEKYTINNQQHSDLYRDFVQALQNAADSDLAPEHKRQLAETFSAKKLQTKQPHWINDKRKKAISPILAKLRGE